MSETESLAKDAKNPCTECGEEDEKVRVWESKEDWEDDQPPDYVGCFSCGLWLDLKSQ